MFFDFDENLKLKVKSVPGAVYSSTHRCFYVDDSEENLKLILRTLKEAADVDITFLTGKKEEREADKQDDPAMEVTGNIASGDRKEEFRNSSATIRRVVICQGEGGHKPDIDRKFGPVEFRVNEKEGLLVIRFTGYYDREWIREMRSYGKLEYDSTRKEWFLPWKKFTCDSLADYFAGRGVKVNVRKQFVEEKLAVDRKLRGDEIRSKPLSDKARDSIDLLGCYLDDNRYSQRTRESYLAMLEFFFRYFSHKDPSEISEEEITQFIHDHIIRLGYSPAYQNQMVSAIKTYYNIAGKGKVDPGFLERPRRRRALPKVFSKEEVSAILNSSGNLKHKLLLWMIYSCGLRRSEVTNIKLTDLDRERNILHIREGKGMVDRFVPIPDKVWLKVDEYTRAYKPVEYLFEGQTGGKYSTESVYRVFKDAMLKAGIKKDVGVHSLRHSYATHLHENGLDIRYIQELLGHRSTRTTEIYTHVSRRNLIAVRSPIDDLDVK